MIEANVCGAQRIAPKFLKMRRRLGGLAVMLGVAVVGAVYSQPTLAQTPAVVGSSAIKLNPAGGTNNGRTVVDACGDVFVNQSNGGVIEIQAGTGALTVLVPNTNGYNNGPGIAIDAAKTALYYATPSQWYSSQFTKVPIANCTLGAPAAFATNLGNLAIYYYGTASDIAGDASGNVFFATTAGNKGQIIKESSANVPTVVQASWPNSLTSLASDAAGNVYFTDGTPNVYLIKAPYTAAAASITAAFTKPVGLSFDPQGNLYVADGTLNAIYEIPNETSGLNVAHAFEVVSVPVTNNVGVDAAGNIYLSNYNGNVLEELVGAASLPSTAYGQASATGTVNFVFNSALTGLAAKVTNGTSTTSAFTAAAGCGGAYKAGDSCSITVGYNASAVGLQTAALTLSDATGAALSTVTLSGVGLGAAVTVDPGTTTAAAGTFKTPNATTVDSQGNVYVVDAGNKSVTKYAGGVLSSAGVAVSTGTLTLNAPSGIAVDAAGNIYIADTGNNQIVEIPVIKGVLTSSAAAVVAGLGLKSPSGLAVDGRGNLYIADSGNNRLLFVPNHGGFLVTSAPVAYGTGLSAPSAVAVDASGNVYVTDSGNGAVVEFAGPIGSALQVRVATGLSSPSAIATDASGSVYVADKGNQVVVKFPLVGGVLGTKTIVSGAVNFPVGVAVDASGNLIVTDSTVPGVYTVARVQTQLPFGGWNIGTTSTPLTANVANEGNQALTVSSPSYTVSGNTAAGFSVTTDGCATASPVAPGASCNITAQFKPPVMELNAEEDLTLATNTVLSTPKIALIGTGGDIKATTLTVAQTSPAAGTALTVVTPVTFTATVGRGTATATPGGTVTFFVNGSRAGAPVPVTLVGTSYQASITISGGLPAGTAVNVSATYSGDSLNYSGSQASIQVPVSALPNTLTLTLGTPFTNPASALDNVGNATGPTITLIATIAVQSPRIPSGTVTFYNGSTVLGTASLNTSGVATITTNTLRAGKTNVVENNYTQTNYALTGVYSGDSNYVSTTSNAAGVAIVAPPATLPPCAAAGNLTITATSLVGGVATYTFTATSGTIAVGNIINITGTTNGSGIFNKSGVTVASVSGSKFTVNGFDTTLTIPVAAAAESGKVAPVCSATGGTFAITPTNPTITITNPTVGQGAGSVLLTISSYGGWNGVVNFTCSGLPAYASCTPFPGAPTITPSTSSVSIPQTTVQFVINTNVTPPDMKASGTAWWMGGPLGLMLLLMRRRLKRFGGQGIALALGLFMLMAASVGTLTACGTGFGQTFLTPKGTSAVVVKVSAGELVPGTTNGSTTGVNDVNTGSFTITLNVQ